MNNERTRPRPPRMLVVVMGISTLALGLALVNHLRPSSASSLPGREASADASLVPASPGHLKGADEAERMRTLERRVAELERFDKGAEPSPSEVPDAAELSDSEALPDDGSTWWESVLNTHGQQHRDVAWSGEAEGRFRLDLTAMAQGRKFEVIAIDCRTTSCAATLNWPSYSPNEVRSDAGFIAGYVYQENCATSISVPPPKDMNAPYQAQVVFDCAKIRAGLAHR